jgi:hypothetical protein
MNTPDYTRPFKYIMLMHAPCVVQKTHTRMIYSINIRFVDLVVKTKVLSVCTYCTPPLALYNSQVSVLSHRVFVLSSRKRSPGVGVGMKRIKKIVARFSRVRR